MQELLSKQNKRRNGEDASENEVAEKNAGNATWMDRLENLTGRDFDGDGHIGQVIPACPVVRHHCNASVLLKTI